jgi:hypothetical protein
MLISHLTIMTTSRKNEIKNWKILNYSVLVFIADNIFRSASGRIPF